MAWRGSRPKFPEVFLTASSPLRQHQRRHRGRYLHEGETNDATSIVAATAAMLADSALE
jgi:hypothetical protein